MTRNDFKKILWQSADRLRSAMDGSEYKHIVLGLLFLKYLSDSFEKQR
ncbi:MAG: type I restriction-modification system subunit M N-terminal domain-containing protein, partial [Alphaproteobacteria bacterium]|nr:type I restriction-modification system subunit M N-terminal domain-containing protein [Alphaproteobacteria bacterium]